MSGLCALRTRVRLFAAPSVVLALVTASLIQPSAAPAASAPAVSKISATTAPLKGGSVITISGKNFSKISSVRFGTTTAKFSVKSSTRISATVPKRAAGTVDIRVVGRYGTSKIVTADRFSYIAAPTVTSVGPTAGTELGGTAVTVTGKDFRDVTSVTFAGVKATKISVSSSGRLVATAPKHAAGTVDVRVVSRYGTSSTNSKARFAYQSVPQVSTSSLPTASAGVRYAAQLTGAKGTKPYRWSGSALPAGLTLNSAGLLSGVVTVAPQQRVSATITITVTDAKNLHTTRTVTLPVQPSQPKITGTLGEANTGRSYRADLIVADGRAGTWSVLGSLPAGLSFAQGRLSGTPTQAGTSTITVRFTDAAKQSSTLSTTLTVTAPGDNASENLDICTARTIRFDGDDATGAIGVPFPITFNGTQTQFFVSPNGYLTFGSGTSQASPIDLGDFGQPVIAPFLADTDTLSTGGSGTVTWGVSRDNTQLCVMWSNVGYWERGVDKTNTFQVLLTSRPEFGTGAFDVTFNYERIAWDAGAHDGGIAGLAQPGGVSARAGWSTGLLATTPATTELPGSGVPGALLDSGSKSLVANTTQGVPGRYSFGLGR